MRIPFHASLVLGALIALTSCDSPGAPPAATLLEPEAPAEDYYSAAQCAFDVPVTYVSYRDTWLTGTDATCSIQGGTRYWVDVSSCTNGQCPFSTPPASGKLACAKDYTDLSCQAEGSQLRTLFGAFMKDGGKGGCTQGDGACSYVEVKLDAECCTDADCAPGEACAGNSCITPPPLTVDVTGPNYISSGGNYTWNVSASGGVGGYTYTWYRRTHHTTSTCTYTTPWQQVGTGTSYSSYEAPPDYKFQVKVNVTSGSQTAYDYMTVYFSSYLNCPG